MGTELILVPSVSVIAIDDAGRMLLGLHVDTQRWSTIGGAIDPDESPLDAVRREVREELGVDVSDAELLGAYGGPHHRATYPNGDRAAFVTIAYRVTLDSHDFVFADGEIAECRWVDLDKIGQLPLYRWLDDMLPDLRVSLARH